jgi:uncharacterized membrane protein YuzA (DUF378 family)
MSAPLLAECAQRQLSGASDWVVWYAGALLACGVGLLGTQQARGSDPLMRAPFAAMLAVGLVSLVPVDADVAARVMAGGAALACWLGVACVVDDAVDRAVLARGVRAAVQAVVCGVALLQLSLTAREPLLATRCQSAALLVAGAGAFRATAAIERSTEAPELGGETAAPVSVDATVARAADLALVSSVALMVLVGAATAWELVHGGCADLVTVEVLGMLSAFAGVFYLVIGIAALRARVGRASVACTYVLWRGVLPIVGERCVVTAQPAV